MLGEEHPATLTSINNLALLASYQGKYAEAEAQFVQLLETMRRVLGDEHLETMISEGNLGIVYYRQGRYAEAETVFTKVLEQKQRVLGEQHPETLTSMNNLGVALPSPRQVCSRPSGSTRRSWTCSAGCSVTIIRTCCSR